MTIADIRTLVAERQRFDDWLAALEVRRAETPVRVFERVHADYLGRRDGVVEKLHAHVGALEALEAELNGRLRDVEAQLADHEDERAEAMLRTAVGEFSADEWEATRHGVDTTLAGLEQERQALLAETEDIRALLASATHTPAPAAAPARVPVRDAVHDTREPMAAAVALPIEGVRVAPPLSALVVPPTIVAPVYTSAAKPAATGIDFTFAVGELDDELADIDPASARPEQSGPASNSGEFAGPAAPVANDDDDDVNAAVDALGEDRLLHESLDDIDVFGDATQAARRAGDTRAGEAAGRPSGPPVAMQGNDEQSADGFDDLAFLRSVTASGAQSPSPARATTEPVKTLRCTECGTMNFPTEWYCERCGGELAAF